MPNIRFTSRRGDRPWRLLGALGIERVPADEVTLKPCLMDYAVEQ